MPSLARSSSSTLSIVQSAGRASFNHSELCTIQRSASSKITSRQYQLAHNPPAASTRARKQGMSTPVSGQRVMMKYSAVAAAPSQMPAKTRNNKAITRQRRPMMKEQTVTKKTKNRAIAMFPTEFSRRDGDLACEDVKRLSMVTRHLMAKRRTEGDRSEMRRR